MAAYHRGLSIFFWDTGRADAGTANVLFYARTPGQQTPGQIQHGNEGCKRMLFAIKHCNTDIDNADAITRETSLTTMQTNSLWHVVLFI